MYVFCSCGCVYAWECALCLIRSTVFSVSLLPKCRHTTVACKQQAYALFAIFPYFFVSFTPSHSLIHAWCSYRSILCFVVTNCVSVNCRTTEAHSRRCMNVWMCALRNERVSLRSSLRTQFQCVNRMDKFIVDLARANKLLIKFCLEFSCWITNLILFLFFTRLESIQMAKVLE